MGARRDLGHNAAIGRMILDLAAHDIGEDLRPGAGLGARRTTAAAVSSQLVSMPKTVKPAMATSGKAR